MDLSRPRDDQPDRLQPPSERSIPSGASPAPPSDREARAHRIRAHEIAIAVRNSLKLGGSLLVTWSVAFIVKQQVPLHLGPVRQGHFAFAESFAIMFFAAIGFGVDTYVIKEVSVRPNHASDFVGGVFLTRALLGTLFFIAMIVTLRRTGRGDEILPAAAIFGVTQLLLSINATYAAILQATTHVGGLAIANVVGKVVWGAGLLLGLHYQVPLYILALPMLGAELLKAAFLAWAARETADLHLRVDFSAALQVFRASVPFFVNGVVITFGSNLALSALEYIRRDEREVGWFAATQNLAALAMLLHPLFQWVVMPMFSRAQSRSPEEMMSILRRAIEGLVVVIAPVTTMISAASVVLVRLLFHDAYLPAATGVSILSLVFLMTYLNIILSSALIISGRAWSVTFISLGAITLLALFMLIFVPAGRALMGTGGECAGAAVATIAAEAYVNAALLWRFRYEPLDRRNVSVLLKSIAISATVLIIDRLIRGMGAWRLLVDIALYVALALALRVVRPTEVEAAVRMLRGRGKGAPLAEAVQS